jgi:hypothetical protein
MTTKKVGRPSTKELFPGSVNNSDFFSKHPEIAESEKLVLASMSKIWQAIRVCGGHPDMFLGEAEDNQTVVLSAAQRELVKMRNDEMKKFQRKLDDGRDLGRAKKTKNANAWKKYVRTVESDLVTRFLKGDLTGSNCAKIIFDKWAHIGNTPSERTIRRYLSELTAGN